MGRYIKKFTRVGFSLGPSEERGFAMWVGYDVPGVEEDLSAEGLIRVDDWTEQQLAEYNVATFKSVSPEELGIQRKR